MYSLLLRKKGWILILAVLMAACLLPLGIYAEANAGAFKDVDRAGWYYDDLNYSVENGLIKGMSETRFAPADKVTRAQYVTILGRIEGASAVPSQKVSDVGTNHFAYDYVTWAIEKGITNGVGISDKGIRFDPNGNMTREQLAVFTMRYLRSKGIDPSNLPQDQGLYLNDARDISDWAFKDMFYFHRAGLVVGENGDQTIGGKVTAEPKESVTRAEVTAVLCYIDKFLKGGVSEPRHKELEKVLAEDSTTVVIDPQEAIDDPKPVEDDPEPLPVQKTFRDYFSEQLQKRQYMSVNYDAALDKAAGMIGSGQTDNVFSAMEEAGFEGDLKVYNLSGENCRHIGKYYIFKDQGDGKNAEAFFDVAEEDLRLSTQTSDGTKEMPYTHFGYAVVSGNAVIVAFGDMDWMVVDEEGDALETTPGPSTSQTPSDASMDLVKISAVGYATEAESQAEIRKGLSYIKKYVPENVISRFNELGWQFAIHEMKSYAVILNESGLNSASGLFSPADKTIYIAGDANYPATYVHELGHFVDYIANNGLESASTAQMYNQYKTDIGEVVVGKYNSHYTGKVFTADDYKIRGADYAMSNASECFAEAFKMYIMAPDQLKAGCPAYYRYIEQCLGRIYDEL